MQNSTLSKWLYFGGVGLVLFAPTSAYSYSHKVSLQTPCIQSFPYSLYEIVVVELKRREGFSSVPYRDGEGWAIGYGQHYKTKQELPPYPIGEKKATQMLQQTLQKEYIYIQKLFPKFNEYQLWAILSLSYNIGLTKMKSNAVFWEALNAQNTNVLKQEWLRAFATSENKQKSRELEWALFSQDLDTVKKLHLAAKSVVIMRYSVKKDFAIQK